MTAKYQQWRSRIRLYAVAVALCLFCTIAFAQEGLTGPEFARLERDIRTELGNRYQAAQQTNELFPGATLAVGFPDGRIAEFAIGLADMELGTVMSVETRMPTGSIGKTYVSAVTLSMVTEGSLALDGKIADWLGEEPWFARLPNGASITLRQLLNHSSGIIDHVFDTDSRMQDYFREQLGAGDDAQVIDPRTSVQFVLDREPLFAAGEGFHYSDTNYILLGLIIEKVGGSTYYELLTERFLRPLHLVQTTHLDRRDIERLAQGYAPRSQRLFGLPFEVVEDGTLVFDPSIEWTGGGLVTSSADLVRWAIALFEGKAIGRRYVDEMLTSIAAPERFADDPGRAYGYGLGISIVHTKFGVAYRHGGFFPGYNSMLAWFPERGFAVAMQINNDASNIEEHFDAIVAIIVDNIVRNQSQAEVDG